MSIFSNRSVDPPEERAQCAKAVLELLEGREPMTRVRQLVAFGCRWEADSGDTVSADARI